MKNKKIVTILSLSTLLICVAILAVGIYAITNTSLSTSGKLGFVSYNCEISVYGVISGAVVNPASDDVESKDLYLVNYKGGDFSTEAEFNFKGELELTFDKNLWKYDAATKVAENVSTIYFNDDGGKVQNIVFTLYVKNNSKKEIPISISNFKAPYSVTYQTSGVTTLEAQASDYSEFVITLVPDAHITEFDPNKFNFNMEISFGGNADSSTESTNSKPTPVSSFTFDGSTVTGYIGGKNVQQIVIPRSYSLDINDNPIPGNAYNVNSIRKYSDSEGFDVPSIVILDNITSISDGAFSNCKNLREITIPSSVTTFGTNAFLGCDSLSEVHYNGDLTQWMDISFSNVNCNPLQNGTDLYINELLVRELNLEGYSEVKPNAFYGCKSIRKVIFSDSITAIGQNAFKDCDSIMEVYVDSLRTWLNIDFSDGSTPINTASSLYANGKVVHEVDFTGYNEVKPYVFCNYENLYKLTIPDKITTIGTYAFYNCNLKEINLPSTLKSIEGNAFTKGGNVHFNGTIQDWYNINFTNSSPLNGKLYIDGELVTSADFDGYTKINPYVFNSCTSLRKVVIPDSVTSIGTNAFYGCKLLQNVTLPNRLQEIGENAFAYCTMLTNVEIPSTVTKIGKSALSYIDIQSITIPASVNKIEDYLFEGCGSLNQVILEDGVTEIGCSPFKDLTHYCTLVLPTSITKIDSRAFERVVKICYMGNEQQYKELINNNSSIYSPTLYYKVENAEEGKNVDFNYWYYDDQNNIVVYS